MDYFQEFRVPLGPGAQAVDSVSGPAVRRLDIPSPRREEAKLGIFPS